MSARGVREPVGPPATGAGDAAAFEARNRSELLGAAPRADWRFLLDDPQPARVAIVGRPDGALRDALSMCCAVPAVWNAPPASEDAAFDLVVVTSPQRAAIAASARLLAPGGTLRWEAPRAVPTSAACEALRRAGLEEVRAYWHHPSFAASLEAIPLDGEGALDHVLRPGTHGWAGEMRRGVARAARRLRLLDVTVPCRAISGRRGGLAPGGLPRQLGRIAAARGGGSSERVSLLLRTPRFRASGHVLLFAFPEGASQPVVVAKVARVPGASPSIEREARSLEALSEVPGGVEGVPALLQRVAAGGSQGIVETVVPGDPVHPSRVRRDPDAHLAPFATWVVALHRTTRVYTIAETWWGEAVERPLRRIETLFGLASAEGELARRTREIVAPMRDGATGWVLEHGDLSAPNLLLDGRRPGIVDWELGTTHGIPGADLFFLLAFGAVARDGATDAAEGRAALRRAFFGRDPWAAEWTRRYAPGMQVPLGDFAALYVLAWARNVASYIERVGGEQAVGAAIDDLREWLRSERAHWAWADAVRGFAELRPAGDLVEAAR